MRHHTPSPRPPRLPKTRARLRAARRATWRGLIRAGSAIAAYWYSAVGLALIAGAAFTIDRALGLLVAGIGVLVFEWRVRGAETPPEQPPQRAQRR